MGFAEILTIIFVLLKVFGIVAWSWWIVFLPEIIALAVYALIIIITSVITASRAERNIRKHFKDM